jgi:prepilin-type N-terminal cleavage/methylation domain-containing protein
MNNEQRTNKAFTLIELVVAIAILVMMISFAGVIFKVSINSHRTAMANTEIMQKLRAITDQLNRDFKGLRRDGYLILHSDMLSRKEYVSSAAPADFRADRVFYFSTGDFQSWFGANIRSNLTKVYFGHDKFSLDPMLDRVVSKWSLARDVKLITPGLSMIDSNSLSYAGFKADVPVTETYAKSLLIAGIPIDIQANPDDVRGLMCRNVGEIKIEWTDGTKAGNDMILWYGLMMPKGPMMPNGTSVEEVGLLPPDPPYRATWTPLIREQYWPRALKFTFKLYDSRGILKEGRLFSHIVYFGD